MLINVLYETFISGFFSHSERNLNPKAACLKKREEEKALGLISEPGPSGLCPEGNPSSGGLISQATPTPATPTFHTYSSRLLSTPSPPPLTSADKIPRKSDPPMKRRGSTGALSPTLRKTKARMIAMASNSALHSSQPDHAVSLQ